MRGNSGEGTKSLFSPLQLRQHSLDGWPVQGRRTTAYPRGAVSAGTGGSEAFSGARLAAGGTERGSATLPAASDGYGPESLGLSLLARDVVRTEREYLRRADRV